MNVEVAIDQFRTSAVAKAQDDLPAEQDHALHKAMAEAWRHLKATIEGRRAFEALLKDQSLHVRLWAASQLLSDGHTEAMAVIEAAAEAGGIEGFNAKMVLKEWQAGRLRSPFGGQ